MGAPGRKRPILRGADVPTGEECLAAPLHEPRYLHGTIPAFFGGARPLWTEPLLGAEGAAPRMTQPKPRQVFIQGITVDGRTFRPSDWAERLCGAMSCFRPEGVRSGIGAFIGYSPYCVPRVINGVKYVIVNEKLREVEPMAWDFVMNFARDNCLQTSDACLLPHGEEASLMRETPEKQKGSLS